MRVLCAAKRPCMGFCCTTCKQLWVTLAVIDAMDIHLPAAVSAVHQAGSGMGLAPAVRVAPDICPDTLHIVKGFLVDDGLMGISRKSSTQARQHSGLSLKCLRF